MMWRLNFFVLFCCLALRNSYVLYYICPMHTLFTLIIYGILGVAPKARPCRCPPSPPPLPPSADSPHHIPTCRPS